MVSSEDFDSSGGSSILSPPAIRENGVFILGIRLMVDRMTLTHNVEVRLFHPQLIGWKPI